MSPSSGLAGTSGGLEGTEVTIRGLRLEHATRVEFHDGVEAPVLSSTSREVLTRVPLGARTGRIIVHTDEGWDDSPADFAVVDETVADEEPTNNIHPGATPLEVGQVVDGRIEARGDFADRYVIDTGRRAPGAIWAWTTEIILLNKANNGEALVLEVTGTNGQSLGIPPLEVPPDRKEPGIRWVTVRSNRKLHLSVTRKRPFEKVVPYELRIGRVPIDDQREPNDEWSTATAPPHSGSSFNIFGNFLVRRYDPASPSTDGLPDLFEMPGPVPAGHSIGASVNLRRSQPPFPVKVALISENGDRVEAVSQVGDSSVGVHHQVGTQDQGLHWRVELSPVGTPEYFGEGPMPAHASQPVTLHVFVRAPLNQD